jgi:hypothetical protein
MPMPLSASAAKPYWLRHSGVELSDEFRQKPDDKHIQPEEQYAYELHETRAN